MRREKGEGRRDKRRQGGRSGDVERERRERARETGKEGDREEERQEKRAEEQEPLRTNPSTNGHDAEPWRGLDVDLQFVFSRVDGPSDLSPGKIYAQLNLAVVNFLFVCFFS